MARDSTSNRLLNSVIPDADYRREIATDCGTSDLLTASGISSRKGGYQATNERQLDQYLVDNPESQIRAYTDPNKVRAVNGPVEPTAYEGDVCVLIDDAKLF